MTDGKKPRRTRKTPLAGTPEAASDPAAKSRKTKRGSQENIDRDAPAEAAAGADPVEPVRAADPTSE
ncbi:MAG: hypothetical protein M3619_20645, partial [Myxococcota bacterium]|nr:hypothetical protein [Myxococcota bacterium]